VADEVGALVVLLFLSVDKDNMGPDLPVAIDCSSAVTLFAADLAVLVKLELWLGHLISSL
jgi:hypothetical protein